MLAARADNRKVVERLLAMKASVDAQDHRGWTALHHAAFWNRVEVVRMLRAAGADGSIKDANRETAADVAQSKGNAEVVTALQS
jgi:ankyrin repeat protein